MPARVECNQTPFFALNWPQSNGARTKGMYNIFNLYYYVLCVCVCECIWVWCTMEVKLITGAKSARLEKRCWRYTRTHIQPAHCGARIVWMGLLCVGCNSQYFSSHVCTAVQGLVTCALFSMPPPPPNPQNTEAD